MTKKDFAKALFEKGIFVSKAELEGYLKPFYKKIPLEAKVNFEVDKPFSLEVTYKGKDYKFLGEVVQKAERMGRNPKTGEEIKIEAKKSVKFKAGKTLVDKIN